MMTVYCIVDRNGEVLTNVSFGKGRIVYLTKGTAEKALEGAREYRIRHGFKEQYEGYQVKRFNLKEA